MIEKADSISRNDVYSFIEKNHKNKLDNYPLYINYNEKMGKNQNDNGGETNGNSTTISNKTNQITSFIMDNQNDYESFSKEFKNIENKNNGLFSISLFEDMLRQINVSEILIHIIGDFLRKKTQKTFINFNTFKEVLSLILFDENLSQSKYNTYIYKGLFILLSYPKNYIDKNSLLNIFVNNIDTSFIGDKIEFSQFYKSNILNNNNHILESYEHIKFLKYIFFGEKVENHSIECKCIAILLKNKTIESYIKERLQFDSKFYLIDKNFWDKWEEMPEFPDNEKNNSTSSNLEMKTESFCEISGVIKEGKEYLKDYLIISETMYNLFINWYGVPQGGHIVRYKIYLNDENSDMIISKDQRNPIIQDIEKRTKKKFELEMYPIFIKLYSLENLLKISNNSYETLKVKLKKIYMDKEAQKKSFQYSRKTKFLDHLETL